MAKRTVPFFPYPKVFTEYEEEIINVIRSVGRRGAFILQDDLEEFERNIARLTGAKYCVGVGNATDGLWMLCRAAGLGPGDEVIFCTHTMVATAAGIYFTGATPVPAEAGWDHEIDVTKIEELITPRTKAIMVTQLNGRCADMDALQDICNKHGFLLLEDAAQALGAKYKGKCAGTFGLGGVISFYPAKVLGCLGDGGCIITNNEEIYEKVRMYRDHGRKNTFESEVWSLNSRLDNLQAAILNFKLTKYHQWIERRRQIARMYQERLSGIKEIVLPPGPDDDKDRYDIFQNYEIEADKRDELQAYLRENGVGTIVQWGGKPVHMFRKLGFTQSLPYTESLFKRLLLLPMNHFLEDDDVEYICDLIIKFYRRQS